MRLSLASARINNVNSEVLREALLGWGCDRIGRRARGLVGRGSRGFAANASAAALLALTWSLVLAGILLGGTLGIVFWYRWVSVPRRFNDPFGPARMALVAIHIGLVLVGAAIVFNAT